MSFSELGDGRIAIHIVQIVRSPDGPVISEGDFLHLHRIEGDHIARMDIEASEPLLGRPDRRGRSTSVSS